MRTETMAVPSTERRTVEAKVEHGPLSEIRLLHITAVKPSPENDKLYRPVRREDPSTQDLADDIKKHGVKEPLVLTLDNYLLSGHRRRMAAIMAGISLVPVRYEDIRRGDGEEPEDARFLPLLRTYNRQRVKGFDEVLREQAIDINPEQAYRALLQHREETTRVTAEMLEIPGTLRRKRISAAKEPFLAAVIKVLEGLRRFWPLTDRWVHYNLLNAPPLKHASKPKSLYVNDRKSYKSLCDLLTRARLVSRIPFAAIADPTRPVVSWNRWVSVGPFIARELDWLLKDYRRDLQQSQPTHIEIIGEKNTIEPVIRPVASRFCIPYTIGRGYSSLDPRKKVFERFQASGKDKLVLLVVSDFDAEGEDIPVSFARSMRDDFKITSVECTKVALTQAQVQERGESFHPNPIKEKSSRAAAFKRRYGDRTYELEALPPAELQRMLTEAVDSVLDVEAFNRELDREKEEAGKLEKLRRHLASVLTEAARGLDFEGEEPQDDDDDVD